MLAIRVLYTLLSLVLISPRALYWVVIIVASTWILAKARKFTVGLVAACGAAVAFYGFIDDAVRTARDKALGYDTSHYAVNVASVVAIVGAVALAVALCCVLDGHIRATTLAWLSPHGSIDATRAIAVAALAIMAVFPVVRAFTGPTSFSTVVAVQDQNLFPGYATPRQVADGMRARFLREGAPVSSVSCSYFAPNLPAPPVYNCDAILTFSDGETQYHDNVQSTGRPGGTFSCEDDTSGVPRRLC